MKITLFLTMSLDGFIAKPDDSVTWSDDAWNNYFEYCSGAGSLIVGRKSFDLMQDAGDFEKLRINNLVIISSKPKPLSCKISGAHFVQSPHQAIEYLRDKGIQHAVVGGGSRTARSFFDASLLTDMELDVEPQVYAEGVHVLGASPVNGSFQLVSASKSGADTVRLHYSVRAGEKH